MSSQNINIPEHAFKGHNNRCRIPHCDTDETLQSITFRLADSLPRDKLVLLEQELKCIPEDNRETERRKKIESWLDKGIGCCALAHPEVAEVTQNTLKNSNKQKYQLFAWCIMPTHVHVLILQKDSLSKIVQSWKSFTGRWAMANNKRLRLGITGKSFWMRDYWDRYIRNEKHFYAAVDYIHQNPVKAGLCKSPQDWRWSSAFPGNAWRLSMVKNKAGRAGARHSPGEKMPAASLSALTIHPCTEHPPAIRNTDTPTDSRPAP